MSAPTRRPSRDKLNRTRVIETAITYVDEHGLPALTMRRLGEVLGVEAMSLYHHVNGREDLLEGIVDFLVAQVRVPPRQPDGDGELGPADGWQAFLQHVAHAVRAVAVDHPRLFALVATRPPAAPWLRPPLRSLRLVEEFLQGLLDRGLSEADAVHVYKVFAGFLLGHLLLEIAQEGAATGPADEPLDEGNASVPNEGQRLSLREYPTVQRLQPRLSRHDAECEFEDALEALLVRLDGELSQ